MSTDRFGIRAGLEVQPLGNAAPTESTIFCHRKDFYIANT